MEQLIEITRVPIEIEMRTSRAHLEYAKGSAELEITRDKGGYEHQEPSNSVEYGYI